MHRSLFILLAAVGLLAGCGEQPAPPQAPVDAAPSSATTTGTLVVVQEGSAPDLTLWYVRVEDMKGTLMTESAFPGGPIELTKDLPAAGYRVMSWHRSCTGTCPATGEEGLGPLVEVCGTQAQIAPGEALTVAVTIDADGACTVQTA